jgi:hypothetical protein
MDWFKADFVSSKQDGFISAPHADHYAALAESTKWRLINLDN